MASMPDSSLPERVGLWPWGPEPNGVGWHFAQAADLFAVPVELVDIIDVGNVEREVEAGVCGGIETDVAPVPGVAGVVEMPLYSPGFVDLDALPGGVVECRGGPGGVVAGVELPDAVDFRGGFA